MKNDSTPSKIDRIEQKYGKDYGGELKPTGSKNLDELLMVDIIPSFDEKVNDEAKEFNDKLHGSTPSKEWEKEIKNYECREYDGIKWIRYDHYLDALSSQLKEVLGRLPKESEKDFESGGSSRDFGYYDSGFNDCLSQVKSVLAELSKLEEEK